MSETPIEWKTIRIDATSYYKLSELSGLMTFVLGGKISLSTVGTWAVTSYYDQLYQNLKLVISNPEVIKEIRKRFRTKLLNLVKLYDEEAYREINELFKLEEGREGEGEPRTTTQ